MKTKPSKHIVNWEKGIKEAGGDETLYISNLQQFERMVLDAGGRALFTHIMKKNWHDAWHEAAAIKQKSSQ